MTPFPTGPVISGAALPVDLTRDYYAWLAAAGADRLTDMCGQELEDPTTFAAAVRDLFLDHHQPVPLDAFVDAHHGPTLRLVRDRLTLTAASLDGSHAGGCG